MRKKTFSEEQIPFGYPASNTTRGTPLPDITRSPGYPLRGHWGRHQSTDLFTFREVRATSSSLPLPLLLPLPRQTLRLVDLGRCHLGSGNISAYFGPLPFRFLRCRVSRGRKMKPPVR